MLLRSTLLEEKQFLGKILICDFHISEIKFKINGHEIKTNKWVHTFEWEQIYEKLDDILMKTTEVNLVDLDMSTIIINNYIEVFLKKASVHGKCFAQLLGRKDHEITPVYLKIYIKRLSLCKEELPEIRESKATTPPPSRTLEYDPTINGNINIQSKLEYTPSTISSSDKIYTPTQMKSESNDCNSYVPKPISPSRRDYITSPEIMATTLPPQYKATKISPLISSHTTKKTPYKKKKNEVSQKHGTGSNKNYPKRPSRSDDEENTNEIKKKRENVTLRSKKNPVPISKSDSKTGDKARHRLRDREKESLSSNSSSSSTSRTNSSKDKHVDKSKDIRTFMSPISNKIGKCGVEEFENDKRKVQELKKTQSVFEEFNLQSANERKKRPKPPRDEYLTLKYNSVEDILKTFKKYKSIFDRMVQDFIADPVSKHQRVDGLLQCKTDGIIPERFILEMLTFLTDKYESETNINLSDLFMSKLIPEWLLNLFSQKYAMNRTTSMLQLNYQEEPIEEM